MKSQKILTKCLLPLALFFLSLIFFLAKEKSGTDYAADPAKDNTDSFSDSMAPQSGGADAKAAGETSGEHCACAALRQAPKIFQLCSCPAPATR